MAGSTLVTPTSLGHIHQKSILEESWAPNSSGMIFKALPKLSDMMLMMTHLAADGVLENLNVPI
jgi:hypothetical protein